MNESRVGIVTCFLDNSGACLQAYALQQTINSLGYPNEIIKYTEPWGYYNATIKNSYNLLQHLRSIKSPEFREQYRNGMYKKTAFVQFRKKYLQFTKTEYKSIIQVQTDSNKFDCYVCGSDQIWNPTFYDKCNPVYYLAFVDDNTPKIAYAPSIGLNDIPEKYLSQFIEYISRLDYISVRESKGVELIARYTGKEAKHVLDPTLLLEAKQWDKLIKSKKRKPYVFCYLFGNHDYYANVINHIADQNNWQVRMIPFFLSDIQPKFITEVNAGPIEFLSLIKDAQLVITDSFHASVFSMLFKKDFYVLLRDSDCDKNSMNSRIYSLLNMVGLKDRLLTKEEALSINVNKIENYETVHEVIKKYRVDSINYLKQALRGE